MWFEGTLGRTPPRRDRAQRREELPQAHALLRQQGFGKVVLPKGRQLPAFLGDGSQFGRESAGVLLTAGDPQKLLDLEPGPGQELACREAVLRRALGRHGSRWADIVPGEDLYLNEPMLGSRDKLKTHLLVQRQDESEPALDSAGCASALGRWRGARSEDRTGRVDSAREEG